VPVNTSVPLFRNPAAGGFIETYGDYLNGGVSTHLNFYPEKDHTIGGRMCDEDTPSSIYSSCTAITANAAKGRLMKYKLHDPFHSMAPTYYVPLRKHYMKYDEYSKGGYNHMPNLDLDEDGSSLDVNRECEF